MAISATERVNHVLRRTSFLRARFAAIMRGAGLEPGAAAEIGEGDRVRLAFGYLDRTAGQGVRQRYVEVLIPRTEFADMTDETIERVLQEVACQVEELVHGC